MGATVKHRKSSTHKGARAAHIRRRMAKPQLVTLPSGRRVPAHMVTAASPEYKGKKFLRSKAKA